MTPSSLAISSNAQDVAFNDELAEFCGFPREPAYLLDRSMKGDLRMGFHRWTVIQNALQAWKDAKSNGICPSHFSSIQEEAIITLSMGKTNYYNHNAAFRKLVYYDKSLSEYHLKRYGQMVDWLQKKEEALSDLALWDGIPKTRDGYSLEKLEKWMKDVDAKARKAQKKAKSAV